MADVDLARITQVGAVTAPRRDEIRTLTGEADVDVTAADYTTVGGIALITVTPQPNCPLHDVEIELDFVKTSTGLFVVNTTQTVQLMVQRKVDGTNWRTVQHWPATSSTLGLAVPDAAQDLDAADDSPAKTFIIGTVDPDEEVRITVQLSAETGGDAEVPYRVKYRGETPTITVLAA